MDSAYSANSEHYPRMPPQAESTPSLFFLKKVSSKEHLILKIPQQVSVVLFTGYERDFSLGSVPLHSVLALHHLVAHEPVQLGRRPPRRGGDTRQPLRHPSGGCQKPPIRIQAMNAGVARRAWKYFMDEVFSSVSVTPPGTWVKEKTKKLCKTCASFLVYVQGILLTREQTGILLSVSTSHNSHCCSVKLLQADFKSGLDFHFPIPMKCRSDAFHGPTRTMSVGWGRGGPGSSTFDRKNN